MNKNSTVVNTKSQANQILNLLLKYTNTVEKNCLHLFSSVQAVHGEKLDNYIDKNCKIQMVLPAFPAKSPNNEKISGKLPDMAEVLALKSLNNLCNEIAHIYDPGAEIIICSDGHIFSDLVAVDDADVDIYYQKLINIIDKFQLQNLRTFCLNDVFSGKTLDEMRIIVTEKYGAPIEEIKNSVKIDSSQTFLFNGIHRFIFEDRLVLDEENSRNYIRNYSKQLTYKIIQRSNAWSALVEDFFSEAVRLSIHPHGIRSGKLGIQMVACRDRWGTPWHNILLFDGEKFILTHKKSLKGQEIEEYCFAEHYKFFSVSRHVDKAYTLLKHIVG
ncbi:L-tyrosine/L-tryptophan isonitrile synthase family protein [Candidatus Uabimicrobium sp. HlEnr_7]|uniref:L-tyrosine/L-tryptophan isonitrile synthase family protein n=1 Tax=Candidatus Uabimicrobium helgolandensis TaxID=3095367 RepID=UPI00355612AC